MKSGRFSVGRCACAGMSTFERRAVTIDHGDAWNVQAWVRGTERYRVKLNRGPSGRDRASSTTHRVVHVPLCRGRRGVQAHLGDDPRGDGAGAARGRRTSASRRSPAFDARRRRDCRGLRRSAPARHRRAGHRRRRLRFGRLWTTGRFGDVDGDSDDSGDSRGPAPKTPASPRSDRSRERTRRT